jgi:membrane protease YdiL (CAAX protease family)
MEIQTLTPFWLLAAAIASLWVTERAAVWGTLAAAAAAMAWHARLINLSGLAFALAGAAAIFSYFQTPPGGRLRPIAGALTLLITLALFGHFLPGFYDFTLLTNTVLTPGAYPTSIIWVIDKPLAGLFLVAWCIRPKHQANPGWNFIPTALALFLLLAGLLAGGGILLRVLRWAPRWNALCGWFSFGTLFWVAIPEEALFRSWLQRDLDRRLAGRRWGKMISLATISIVFGLAHFQGGPGLMLSATVAGVFYGLAYQRTGRIEAAILVHLLLNTAHFTLFSYPALVYH